MDLNAIILIAVMAIVTIIIRVLPFLIFNKRETPKYVVYLGQVLPYSIIAMLVVYCFKDVDVTTGYHGLPELMAALLVAGLHIWKRNTLLSIVAGTVFYMVITQMIFVV